MPGGCGCAGGSCSCSIQAGAGLTITGTGNSTAPFIISVAPSPASIDLNNAGALDLSANSGYATLLVNLNANATSVILPTSGGRIDMLIKQGAGGSKTIVWPSALLWPGNVDPVLSTANAATDWITLIQAGGIWAGVLTAKALA